jgi:Flp pilus assembly protein TadD
MCSGDDLESGCNRGGPVTDVVNGPRGNCRIEITSAESNYINILLQIERTEFDYFDYFFNLWAAADLNTVAVGMPTEVVRDILQRAIALQEDLAASGQGTPELQLSAADALAENAQTLLVQGDSQGALDAAERARNILRSLLSQDPNNNQWQHDLAVSYERIGDSQLAMGRQREALDAYQEALKGRRQLAENIPDNAGFQRDLAVSYVKLGDALVVGSTCGRNQRERDRKALPGYPSELHVRIAWKRPPSVTPLQVISIKRILSDRREKVETLLVRFCFLADDECRSKTGMVPASFEQWLIIDILAPSDCGYAADPKD